MSSIKIDKSFVLTMAEDPSNATIVQSTIDLGHNLGLKVVAEGVENVESFNKLAELGCELARDGNPNLEGDAFAGTLLAEAAAAAAVRLVEINLADVLDDPRPAQARGLAARAGAARERALR